MDSGPPPSGASTMCTCTSGNDGFLILNARSPSRREAPEALLNLPPLRGRGERRMPAAPAASCALGSGRTHTSNNEYPGITRRSRTQWFYGLFRALPGDRALLPPSPCGLKVLSSPVEPNEPPQDLTPASGRQDHTTSPYAATSLVRPLGDRSQAVRPALQSRRAQNAAASQHPIPTFVTIMIRPSSRDGMARTCRDDLPDGESEIFLREGLDRLMGDLPVGHNQR